MQAGRLLVTAALAVGLAACGVTVAAVNARPEKYYQHKVTLVGEIVRMQQLTGETLLEIADARGARILVRTTAPLDVERGDWVEVKGILVPEARVGDATIYDVVTADEVSRTHAPRLRNLM
jgi:uncharacterized membrane protein YcgQ (UPF0703/DUF1980 family)